METGPGVDAGRSWRWVFIPLGLFALSRVFSTLWLVLGAQHQVALPEGVSNHVAVPTSAAPGYLGVISNWDGQWYRSIAESGYPELLPNEMGRVMANEWAFLPGYPMVVRLVMEATGLSFPVAATIVSLTSASLALVLLYGMVMRRGGHPVAFTAVLAVCVYPTSPVLQLPYAESLALLLVLLALALLGSRRYWLLVPVCVALALTRQVVLAVAVVLLVHGVARWLRRREDPVPPKEWVALTVAAAVCVSSTMLWPGIAAVVTGVPDAYLRTYSAWWSSGSSSMLSRGWIGTSLARGRPCRFGHPSSSRSMCSTSRHGPRPAYSALNCACGLSRIRSTSWQ